ncbi:MAG: glutaredoxin family protein [Moraxella sp.]|nr:glutaredoxin family protein [Moraxella sp.]
MHLSLAKSVIVGLVLGLVACMPNYSNQEIQAIAQSVKAGEITMYSTQSCPYCRQMRNWLNSHSFVFKECDIEVNEVCRQEYDRYGGEGVPFIRVWRNQKQTLIQGGDGYALLDALK